jgi:glycosyltransferase involved in cell wall biosynthesis
MRIAIYENLPPGGAKRASFEFGRYLATRHELDLYQLSITNNRAFDLRPIVRQVFSYRYRPVRGLLQARLLEGHYAPRSYTLFRPLRQLHRRIAADMTLRNYDLVLAHTDAMTQAPYLLRSLTGVTTVYYCQEVYRVAKERSLQRGHREDLLGSRFPIGNLRLLEDLLVRRRLIGADAASAAAAGTILVNSKYSREQVFAAYARNASVCYLGVDPGVFHPDPATGRRQEVLSVGGPARNKGHALVIDALGRIEEKLRPALRVITPTHRDSAWLEQLAAAGRVKLTIEQGLDEGALANRYQAAMLTVCAARLEPFGLSALESMACATPVVAIDEAGYRESILPGVTGLLVEPEAAAIAAAIAELIADPGRAAAMGRSGHDWVTKQWTWELAGARLDELLTTARRSASGAGRRS